MQQTFEPRIIAVSNAVTILLFVIGLLLPLAESILKFDRVPRPRERRVLASAPSMPDGAKELKAFPGEFEAYYNDNFGLRSSLLHINTMFKVRLFGVSSSPEVAIGKDGWLYLLGDGLDEYQRGRPYTLEELESWRSTLEAQQRWLDKHGIRFLFVVAPNKHTIYPEFLPDFLRPTGKSPYDQLLDYLYEHTDVHILDLRPALRRAKEKHVVYEKTGTHWNEFGGFIAYQEIVLELKEWFPTLEPWSLSDFEVEFSDEAQVNELAEMLNMKDLYSELGVTMKPLRPRRAKSIQLYGDVPAYTGNRPARRPMLYGTPGKDVNVVILRDSFINRISNFLSEDFRTTLFYPRMGFYVSLNEGERTDVLIMELAERSLLRDPPKPVLDFATNSKK